MAFSLTPRRITKKAHPRKPNPRSLPLELVIEVFVYIKSELRFSLDVMEPDANGSGVLDEMRSQRRRLSFATQVCKSWYGVGTEILYTLPIVLIGTRQVQLFSRTLCSSPNHASFIKALYFIYRPPDQQVIQRRLALPFFANRSRRVAATRSTEAILDVLRTCSNSPLHSFAMSCGGRGADAKFTHRLINCIQKLPSPLSTLRKLTIHTPSIYLGTFDFKVFTALEILCLAGPTYFHTAYPPPLPKVYSLQLYRTVFEGQGGGFIHQLPFRHEFLPSLRSLEWYDSKIVLNSIIAQCHKMVPSIERMIIISDQLEVIINRQVDFLVLSQLRCIILGYAQRNASHEHSPTLSRMILPPSLEIFGIAVASSQEPSKKLRIVNSLLRCLVLNETENRLKCLRRVVVFVDISVQHQDPGSEVAEGAEGDEQLTMGELKTFCTQHDICLEFDNRDVNAWIQSRLLSIEAALDLNLL